MIFKYNGFHPLFACGPNMFIKESSIPKLIEGQGIIIIHWDDDIRSIHWWYFSLSLQAKSINAVTELKTQISAEWDFWFSQILFERIHFKFYSIFMGLKGPCTHL